MNKKSLKDLLFNNVFVIMLVLALIMILITVLSTNIFFKKLYNSTIKQSVIALSRYFNDNFKYLDYYSVEYGKKVEKLLDEMYSVYTKGNFFSEYKRFKSEKLTEYPMIRDINYYIISKDGIIIQTDYQKDLNLNLAQRIPNYWKVLNTRLVKESKFIEKISFEIKTNYPRIYGYRLMDNGNIFEIGVLFDERAIPKFYKGIDSISFNFIEGIYSYNTSFIPYSSEYPLLDKEEKDIFNELDASKDFTQNFIVKELSNGKRVYIYLKWQPENGYPLVSLTKIILDFSDLVKTKNYIIFISLILIGLFVFIFTLYINYNALKVEKPLLKLIKDIENGKVEEIETNIIEIDTLIKYYSHLVSTLVKKLEEEENELINLKKKFEMIEKERDVLYDMALKDELTKFFNKKGSMKIFQRIISNKESFCVVYINLDNYNNVLERMGENVADDMIITLSEIIKKTIRDRDFVFRISEDEFLVLIRYVNLEISQKILKRLVDFVKKFNITTDKDYKISISYGLLEYKGQSVEKIYIEAKKKMEEMKEKKKELLRKLKNNKE
ncbi:GGDEF domain-containing protein [Marinitoga hydrogenitolerans]|uniref:GGDEF domain-containing protein n=1 Tax=Marinitoga hydrogenitolerans TaxID=287990 RepID=UPI001356697F|nr:GGDEF domain-containing protein [Marinitoga hydrogenitolerans]